MMCKSEWARTYQELLIKFVEISVERPTVLKIKCKFIDCGAYFQKSVELEEHDKIAHGKIFPGFPCDCGRLYQLVNNKIKCTLDGHTFEANPDEVLIPEGAIGDFQS